MSELYSADNSFHYPPELLELLVDAIAYLFKSKPSVIGFFRSAGVAADLLGDWTEKLRVDSARVRKHEIARSILVALNERNTNAALQLRREVLKRIVEVEDFSIAWPDDRERAENLVNRIRKVVDQHDSFTRMRREAEVEKRGKREAYNAQVESRRKQSEERNRIRSKLNALFAESDHQKRGRTLESILNDLFRNFDILIKESFTLSGSHGEGVLEQIDGAVELNGQIFLVEIKWWDKPLAASDVAHHIRCIFTRAGAGGILITASALTMSAEAAIRDALQNRVHVVFKLEEIVLALEHEKDLKSLFLDRIRQTVTEKKPFG